MADEPENLITTSDKTTELYEAARELLAHVESSTDSTAEYWSKVTKHKDISRADRMRAEADELDAKDRAGARQWPMNRKTSHSPCFAI